MDDNCDFCSDPVIASFYLNAGCIARSETNHQRLCLHHAMRSEPRDDMILIKDYTVDKILEQKQLIGPWRLE